MVDDYIKNRSIFRSMQVTISSLNRSIILKLVQKYAENFYLELSIWY